MGHSGGINASTRKVPIRVLLPAVPALSTTLLCLTGTDVMSMLVVNEICSEMCLLVFAAGALPSSSPRHTSSAAHLVPKFLLNRLMAAQHRPRQPPRPMMASSQVVQQSRVQTLLQVQKRPSTSQACLHDLSIFKCPIGTIHTIDRVQDTLIDPWQGQDIAPLPSCRAPRMIPHRASHLVIRMQSQSIMFTTLMTDTYLVQTRQQD